MGPPSAMTPSYFDISQLSDMTRHCGLILYTCLRTRMGHFSNQPEIMLEKGVLFLFLISSIMYKPNPVIYL